MEAHMMGSKLHKQIILHQKNSSYFVRNLAFSLKINYDKQLHCFVYEPTLVHLVIVLIISLDFLNILYPASNHVLNSNTTPFFIYTTLLSYY